MLQSLSLDSFARRSPAPNPRRPCILPQSQVSLLPRCGHENVSEDDMNLKIEKRRVDGVTIVSCQGRIMFGDEANALRDFLKQVLTETPRLVLNLAGVTYIDSGGLGTLVGVYSSARGAGADIKLTGLGQRLRDVLQITKLATVFEVFDSEEEALTALGRGAA